MLNTVFVIVNSVAVISCENYTLIGIKLCLFLASFYLSFQKKNTGQTTYDNSLFTKQKLL